MAAITISAALAAAVQSAVVVFDAEIVGAYSASRAGGMTHAAAVNAVTSTQLGANGTAMVALRRTTSSAMARALGTATQNAANAGLREITPRLFSSSAVLRDRAARVTGQPLPIDIGDAIASADADEMWAWLSTLINACAGGSLRYCLARHGLTKTKGEWVGLGLPRQGGTVCLDFCVCQLRSVAVVQALGIDPEAINSSMLLAREKQRDGDGKTKRGLSMRVPPELARGNIAGKLEKLGENSAPEVKRFMRELGRAAA